MNQDLNNLSIKELMSIIIQQREYNNDLKIKLLAIENYSEKIVFQKMDEYRLKMHERDHQIVMMRKVYKKVYKNCLKLFAKLPQKKKYRRKLKKVNKFLEDLRGL